MAAKEPQHFGASIVFTRDMEAEEAFSAENTIEAELTDETGKPTGEKTRRFKSPDPANLQNLPHARCAELHAADLVDDPAATDGMFAGAAGMSLAGQVTEWLDLHPAALKALTDSPEMIAILARYHAEVAPFVARYAETLSKQPAASAEPPAAQPPATPSPECAEMQAKLTAAESELATARAEITRLTGELAGTVTRATAAEASITALTAEVEKLTKQHAADIEKIVALATQRDALLSGQAPVSTVPAPESTLTPMEKARKAARF
jgi:hypothetical protein